MVATVPARAFVPADLNVMDFGQVERLYRALLHRPLGNAPEAQKWLFDFSELSAAVDEFSCRLYINKSCHTDDPQVVGRYLSFVETIDPKIKPLHFQLQRKLIEAPALSQLDMKRYGILIRHWKADVEIFRDENVPLETEITRLVTDYDKICGEMMVQFRGKEYTPQQMVKFLEEPDRPTRQEAWEANTNRKLAEREKMETIFESLLPLRQKIARNSGLANFREHAWKSKKRFDYVPEDCLRFADAIEQTCVPIVKELNARRARDLGLNSLRPWDLDVDPRNQPPLRPFGEDQTQMFVQKTREIFQRLSPQLATDFDQLSIHHNLDLESRKGKQLGGYECSLEESRQPFIFMNAAGLQRDVETLLHEGGHAFHFLAASAREPLVFLRSAPLEFCEVASMSMELLGSEHFDVFYENPADAARARHKLIEGIVRFLPWMATIDLFQHWIYTHPAHSRADRTAHWLALLDRFMPGIDWTAYEAARQSLWHRQLHLFHLPFYYIEYGIAQLGALQLWMKSKQDIRQAIANYRAALALGGTRPLPELFAAAGIVFDFSQKTLRPLMEALARELDAR